MMDAHHTVESELKAWEEAHRHLSRAVLVSKEAVALAKAQRRYWMEEICANLTPEGKPTATSVWKKPTKTTRKTPAKRKLPERPASQKRRRKTDETLTDDEAPIQKPKAKRRRKTDEQSKKKRIQLHLKNPKAQKPEPIVEVYADEADDSEGYVAAMQVHAEPHHHGGISPAFHHAVRLHCFGGFLKCCVLLLTLLIVPIGSVFPIWCSNAAGRSVWNDAPARSRPFASLHGTTFNSFSHGTACSFCVYGGIR
jgi:hypothetical protein